MARFYRPNSLWTWTFLGISLLQALVGLALEAVVFAKFQIAIENSPANNDAVAGQRPNNENEGKLRTIPTYLSVFMFGYLYQLLLVYDALRLKNTIQVIGLCLYNIGILVYAAIQMDQIKEAVNSLAAQNLITPSNFWSLVQTYLLALPILMAVGTVLLCVVTWKLYDEFAWTIYKHISADLKLKRRYLTYQIYIALLKFDFFFFLGFTVQFLVIVTNTSDPEFGLTVAAIPITILILWLAARFTKKENIVGMILIIVIYFGAMAYFLFKLIRMYGDPNDEIVRLYLPARRMLTTFAVITLLLLVCTIVLACVCTHNFNKGLKPHVDRRGGVGTREDTDVKYNTEMPSYNAGPNAAVPSRMTID